MLIFHILWIFLINFCAHPYYFKSQLWRLNNRIREHNFLKSSQYLFNFLYLAELIRNSNKIHYIPIVRKEACELGHHFYNMGFALKKDLIYCPAKKFTKHDGCLFDPYHEKIIEVLQFKTKLAGSNLSRWDLIEWTEDYANLGKLQIGFVKSKDYARHKSLIDETNESQLLTGENLQLSAHDFSLFATGKVDASFTHELIRRQSSFLKQIQNVNDNMIDEFGNIL